MYAFSSVVGWYHTNMNPDLPAKDRERPMQNLFLINMSDLISLCLKSVSQGTAQKKHVHYDQLGFAD